jgi:hypothetical protein
MPRGVFERKPRPVEPRFWAKVNKESSIVRQGMTPCWIWTGGDDGRSETGEGYGKFKYGDRYVRAHRVAYILTHGEIGEGLSVMHRCDNPKCVNPDHLQPGTHAQNMADKVAKGRSSGWSRKPSARLTDEQILEIYNSDKPNRQLAREFGLASTGSVRAIKNGESHRAITRPFAYEQQPFHAMSACTPLPPQNPFQNDPYGVALPGEPHPQSA